jgi:protease I
MTNSTQTLRGRKVAFLVAPEGFEQVELTEPWKAVAEAGGTPELVKGDTFAVDRVVADVSGADYDALVLPGGVANPDFLRTEPAAVSFARGFFDQGKPVAVICHGPWTLIEADVVRGRRITSWPSLATDLRNAGAEWVDEQVVTDQGLVSSRKPDDLPAFCAALIEEFAESAHSGR